MTVEHPSPRTARMGLVGWIIAYAANGAGGLFQEEIAFCEDLLGRANTLKGAHRIRVSRQESVLGRAVI